jgi:hypothetical protein
VKAAEFVQSCVQEFPFGVVPHEIVLVCRAVLPLLSSVGMR